MRPLAAALGALLLWGEPRDPSSPLVPGVTRTEIRVGMCAPLSGPASALGLRLKAGAQVCFDKVNAAGGIHGRRIAFLVRDDQYDPGKTVVQAARLVNGDQVFAMFGCVGTPTASKILPQLVSAEVPFFGPFTGAEFLRTPFRKTVFNVRASYFAETERLVEHLAGTLRCKRIGLFVQGDAFGYAGESGVLRALQKRGLALAGKGTFTRNTLAVDEGLATLLEAKPEAVVMVGTYAPLACFVKKAAARGWNPAFATISFVGAEALAQALGPQAPEVLVSEVMPNPYESTLPLVKEYRKDMEAAGEKVDYTSLEGYVNARIFVEGLARAGPALTRAAFIQGLEAVKGPIGGLRAQFGPSSHEGLKEVYLVKVCKGSLQPAGSGDGP